MLRGFNDGDFSKKPWNILNSVADLDESSMFFQLVSGYQVCSWLILTVKINQYNIFAGNGRECIFHHEQSLNGDGRGVMVIVVGNGHGDTSSNPGRDWLHFT